MLILDNFHISYSLHGIFSCKTCRYDTRADCRTRKLFSSPTKKDGEREKEGLRHSRCSSSWAFLMVRQAWWIAQLLFAAASDGLREDSLELLGFVLGGYDTRQVGFDGLV